MDFETVTKTANNIENGASPLKASLDENGRSGALSSAGRERPSEKYAEVVHRHFPFYSSDQALERVEAFYQNIRNRRSIRNFDSRKIPRPILEHALSAAGCAPSGANKQPWHYVVVENPDLKKEIRIETERIEHGFYHKRAGKKWLEDLEPFGTDENKAHIETCSHVIAVFSKSKEFDAAAQSYEPTYYPLESTCLSVGFLIAALHEAGVGTLTHTPKPMTYLNELLNVPRYYKGMFLLSVGYPAVPVKVPNITKKELGDFVTFHD